jgi:hypothetical protein
MSNKRHATRGAYLSIYFHALHASQCRDSHGRPDAYKNRTSSHFNFRRPSRTPSNQGLACVSGRVVLSDNSRQWLRYLATLVLAVVFLVMSFLGGMVQRIIVEFIPSELRGPLLFTIIAIAVCMLGWLIWRRLAERAP